MRLNTQQLIDYTFTIQQHESIKEQCLHPIVSNMVEDCYYAHFLIDNLIVSIK